MNFDIEKAKRLINIFGNLNAENQEALLVEASRLEINQGLKDQVVKSGKPVTEENLGKATDRFIKVMNPLMDHWDDMGPNNHAALAILLNEMTKGELTKEEHIDFVVSSRQSYNYLITSNDTIKVVIGDEFCEDLEFFALRHSNPDKAKQFKDNC